MGCIGEGGGSWPDEVEVVAMKEKKGVVVVEDRVCKYPTAAVALAGASQQHCLAIS